MPLRAWVSKTLRTRSGEIFIFQARGRNLKGASFDFGSFPRVDFGGADLEQASFFSAQLDRASFAGAQLQKALFIYAKLNNASFACIQPLQGTGCGQSTQLQSAAFWYAELKGASFVEAQLQGAVFNRAQLQGASLDRARLDGASFENAQLQGASLDGASLPGADLMSAALEGASLRGSVLRAAELPGASFQGASLSNAKLQGAWLRSARLQGAQLDGAVLKATDLSDALLWRTSGEGADVSSLKLSENDADQWRPVRDDRGKPSPWNDDAYRDLQQQIFSLPESPLRAAALNRTSRLDCAGKALAACDPSLPLPADNAAWQRKIAAARVDNRAFESALAKELAELVCLGGDNELYVIRGNGFESRIRSAAAGPEGQTLIDSLTNKDGKTCPISAKLTDTDKAQLLRIKQEVIKKRGG
jgi:uncharacterized protein YjbI with pentapeptide repeats